MSAEDIAWVFRYSILLSDSMLLQRAGTLLEQSTQGCKEQLRAIDEFVNVLVRKEVLAHKDKVCITACLVCQWCTLGESERCTFERCEFTFLAAGDQQSGFLQDVKLRNAWCLCHVLRMHAPETPFSSRTLEVSNAHSLLYTWTHVTMQHQVELLMADSPRHGLQTRLAKQKAAFRTHELVRESFQREAYH